MRFEMERGVFETRGMSLACPVCPSFPSSRVQIWFAESANVSSGLEIRLKEQLAVYGAASNLAQRPSETATGPCS